MKQIAVDSIKTILVCQLRQIGDVVLATPAMQMLREAMPRAQVHLLTEKKCLPAVSNNPNIDVVWPIDKKALANPLAALAYYWEIARQDYDMIVDFQQLPRCRWVVAFSGAPIRLSFTPPWYNKPLYSHWIQPLDGYAAMSKASVLRPLGLEWSGQKPRVYLEEAEQQWAQDYLANCGVGGNEILVTVDPSHRRITRRWPAEHFGRVLDLARQDSAYGRRLRFLLLYGPGEKDIAEDVMRNAGAAREFCILPEQMLSLREMAGCISQAALHFGNCSAPRHFAVALDTPTLVVLGATSSAWTFPAPEHQDVSLGAECQPCNKNSCPQTGERRCLLELAPEAVLPRLLAMVKRIA